VVTLKPGTTNLFGVGAVLLAVTAAATLVAQYPGPTRMREMVLATPATYDGDWHFCRLAYRGRAWATDYPDADYNYSTRVSELTRARVSKDPSGDPRPLVVRPTDDGLFQCAFVMMWQVESLYLSGEDAARLRQYLLKGGFIWADDFWGSYGWDNFRNQMAKVLPPPEYAFVDLPANHSIFRTLFDVPKVPQIPGISFWWGSGGRTSEQGADSAEVHATLPTDGSAKASTPAISMSSRSTPTRSASTSSCTR
jgi:hypothetical protein